MDELQTTTGIVALGACTLGLVALIAVAVLSRRIARLRTAQRAIIGDGDPRDLAVHAATLDREFRSLHAYVEDMAGGLHSRLGSVEEQMQGAIAFHGLVRYDAYNEMSGRQSTSIALLDARGTGIVVSSIHHRDQARFYAKQVIEGEGQLELSPEEQEAIRVALAGEVPDRAEQRR